MECEIWELETYSLENERKEKEKQPKIYTHANYIDNDHTWQINFSPNSVTLKCVIAVKIDGSLENSFRSNAKAELASIWWSAK